MKLVSREEQADQEHVRFSSDAAFSDETEGRARSCEPDLYRTEYQRDRDKILHTKAFRRLSHKTQVFLAPVGDHYRTRLTHTLEVAQIARTIARALGLNEDLAEAIALGHDLGHTPFGHVGEQALAACLARHKGIDPVSPEGQGLYRHNVQSLRVVDVIENDGKGLNLTAEVRDGIVCHTGSQRAETLEGRIVATADRIAYVNHDIDDAVRAGIMNEEELPKELRKVLGNSKRERLNTLTHDVIVNSMDKPKICMSEEVREALMELRAYMFTHVYENPLAKGEEDKAIRMVEDLYSYYETHMEKMPEQYLKQLQKGEMPEIAVCDYIAGMTDNFAVKKFEEIFIPQSWKF